MHVTPTVDYACHNGDAIVDQYKQNLTHSLSRVGLSLQTIFSHAHQCLTHLA